MATTCIKVTGGEKGTALGDWLAARLGLSKKQAKALLDTRRVFVNGQRVWMRGHVLQPGDRVEAPAPAAGGRELPALRVLYEDEHYLVVAKPPGLLADGRDSAESAMQAQSGLPELRAIHRLDRDTSGCLWLAKNEAALRRAIEAFRTQGIRKTYHAIVAGRLRQAEGEITAPVDGQRAVSRYRTLDARDEASHVRVTIATGRTHQIRKHFLHIRHPVLGDTRYGTQGAVDDRTRRLPRQMLHAAELEFAHPVTGARVRARADLPPDFRAALRAFRLT